MLPNLVEFLQSTELFQHVEPAALSELARALKLINLHDGDVLIREGDSDDNLYLVFCGCLRVTLPIQRNQAPSFSDAFPGESVGKMAILANDPAHATISASGETSLLALSRALFDRFSATHPHAALGVSEALGKRLQRHQ